MLNKYSIYKFNVSSFRCHIFKSKIYLYMYYNGKYVIICYNNFLIRFSQKEVILYHLNHNKMLSTSLQNVIKGMFCNYKKILEIKGIGYKFELNKSNLLLITIGLSHNIVVKKPTSVSFLISKNKLKIFGFNLNQVSQLAARIKLFKKLDLYKGKGVRALGDVIILKQGKKKKR